MIEKIISGGQTGADRAALDAAIKLNIPHGGWIHNPAMAIIVKIWEKLRETHRLRIVE